MKVNYFDINIIDTVENATVVSLEKTALGSPTLIYNGAEDLHQYIMTSQLDFSFLVSELNSTKYTHLFTGSETRYKVELIDISVFNYPRTIWCGYLLPEQFSEPYKAKDYFINFTATDGVALLKDKEFSSTIDISTITNLSVLEVINQCLLKVGLTLPIRFSEAIQSSVWDLSYLDLLVNTNAYKDDETYLDAFTVLEHCLKSLACKLFQFNGYWYITGLNQQKQTSLNYKEYLYNGTALQFVKTVFVSKDIISKNFNAGASITLIPPYKSVSATWDAKFTKNLLPEDVVEKQTTAELEAIWRKYSNKEFHLSSYYKELLFTDEEKDLLEAYKKGAVTKPVGAFDIDKVAEGPFLSLKYDGVQSVYGGVTSISLLDSLVNYIDLQKPVFINGKSDGKVSASLQIELKTVGYNLFLGAATPIIIDATVVGGYAMFNKRPYDLQVQFQATAHGLVSNDLVSIENEEDASGNVVNDFYTGVYNVIVIDADNFTVAKDYDANYVYTTKCVQITDFSDVDTVEQSLTNHFNREGFFGGIDVSNPNVYPGVHSSNHGLVVGNHINIPVKEGFAKRVYDGVHQTIGNTTDTFQLNFHNSGESYSGKWEILPFKENFLYQIVKDRTVDIQDGVVADELLSNYDFSGSDVKGLYDFDVTQDGVTVKATLNIDNIVLEEDAYYNIRLRPLVTSDYLGNEIVFTKVAFNLVDQQNVTAIFTRNIDYTTALNIDSFHSCNRLENTNRNFLLSDVLQNDFTSGLIPFKSYIAAEDLFVVNGSDKEIVLTKDDVSKVNAGYKLFKKPIDGSTLTEITGFFVSIDDNDFGVVYTNVSKITAVTITTSEELVLQLPTALPDANSCHMFKSLFNRVGVTETAEWQECIAKIYHDLYQKPLVKFNGTVQGLVGPLDLVNLKYNGTKQCTPVNLTINLSEGVTQVTMVENAAELVNDYE